MIDVMSFPVTKDQLAKMTPSERGLLLLLGQASNQVNVLWKLVVICTNRSPTDPIDARVSGAQTQIIVRMMIGILREVWKLVEGRFLGSKLGMEFEPLLDSTSRAALESLKKRFGQGHVIVAVRNSYSFHYPTFDEMEDAFQLAAAGESEDADWNVYMTNTLLNCFFFGSDFVISHGVTKAVGETDIIKAHEKLLGELGPIANELSEFTFGFFGAILKKYLGDEITATIVAKFENAPNIEDLTLPFYVETPTLRTR